MATTLQSLITDVRSLLIAPISGDNADEFWTDAELLGHMNRGIKELWREINDLYEDHFLTVDKTNVSLLANTEQLSGVPADVAIVRLITPRSPATYPYLRFEAKSYDHKDFIAAETQSAQDSSHIGLVYFYVSQAGAPVAAPEIHTAPLVNADIPLTLKYVQTLPLYTATDTNPIPGESDQALISWTHAWARAKEREDRSPDPNIIGTYTAERMKILASLAPRQTQDEEVAEAIFEELW